MKCNSSGLSIVFNILAPLHSLMLLLILFSLDLLFNPALTYWNIFFFMNMLYFFYDLFNKHLRGFPYGGFALKETVPELYCSKAATRTGRFTLIKASTSLSAQLLYEFRFSLFFFLKAQQTVFSSSCVITSELMKKIRIMHLIHNTASLCTAETVNVCVTALQKEYCVQQP